MSSSFISPRLMRTQCMNLNLAPAGCAACIARAAGYSFSCELCCSYCRRHPSRRRMFSNPSETHHILHAGRRQRKRPRNMTWTGFNNRERALKSDSSTTQSSATPTDMGRLATLTCFRGWFYFLTDKHRQAIEISARAGCCVLQSSSCMLVFLRVARVGHCKIGLLVKQFLSLINLLKKVFRTPPCLARYETFRKTRKRFPLLT